MSCAASPRLPSISFPFQILRSNRAFYLFHMFWETFIKLKVDRIAPSVQENLKLTCLCLLVRSPLHYGVQIQWDLSNGHIGAHPHPFDVLISFLLLARDWSKLLPNTVEPIPMHPNLMKAFCAIHWEQMDVVRVRICHWSHQTMLLFWRTRFCRNWDLFINHSYFFSDLLIFWFLKPDYVPGNWVSFSIKIQEMLSALSLLLKFWRRESVKMRVRHLWRIKMFTNFQCLISMKGCGN